jgi:hypothetical protein
VLQHGRDRPERRRETRRRAVARPGAHNFGPETIELRAQGWWWQRGGAAKLDDPLRNCSDERGCPSTSSSQLDLERQAGRRRLDRTRQSVGLDSSHESRRVAADGRRQSLESSQHPFFVIERGDISRNPAALDGPERPGARRAEAEPDGALEVVALSGEEVPIVSDRSAGARSRGEVRREGALPRPERDRARQGQAGPQPDEYETGSDLLSP